MFLYAFAVIYGNFIHSCVLDIASLESSKIHCGIPAGLPTEMGLLPMFYLTGKYNLEQEVEKSNKYKRLPQYAAALAASMSAFSLGTSLAWSSPVGPHLLNGSTGFAITYSEISFIGSLMPIGAAVASVPTGYLSDRMGRKVTLLCLIPIQLIGWALIMWAVNVKMIYAGRFLTGMCGGSSCVACPVFIAEIAHKDIRGELAGLFQLLLAAGVTAAFLVGSQLDVFYFSLTCAFVPVIHGAAFVFFPETPIYYLKRNKREDALNSLKFYRGNKHDIQAELSELADSTRKNSSDKEESAMDVFLSRRGLKAFFISLGLMAFQQLCGINATTFYSTLTFKEAGSSLEPKYATVVMGFMQFFGTSIAIYLADRLGRVPLLGSSALSMAASMILMGTYFYVKELGIDVSNTSWIPVLAVCIFTVMFEVGYGTVPWSLMPEVIPSRIVGMVSSMACFVNWICAFLVTKFFPDLASSIGAGPTFWIYGLVSVVAAIFSFKFLPETKGKSFDEIQREISH